MGIVPGPPVMDYHLRGLLLLAMSAGRPEPAGIVSVTVLIVEIGSGGW